jgi:hypothetical protein
MIELNDYELDLVSGGGEPFEAGKSAGEKFGEALEDVGDAIKDGWNWLVDRVT